MRRICLLMGMMLSTAAAARLPEILPDGPATPLISQAQRVSLGLRNGPDGIVDLWREAGRHYLLFPGAATTGEGKASGATFRIAVDPTLHRIEGPLRTILRAPCRDGGGGPGAACDAFDSHYSGAGTIVPCPGGADAYIYHGEHHAPKGVPAAPGAGWSGIGQALWDPRRGLMVRQGQIIGLNTSNTWHQGPDGPQTDQTAPASGNPSVVADPTDTWFYVYFGDKTKDPEYAGPDAQCGTRACAGMARVRQSDFCAGARAGIPAPWKIRYHGAFTEPAILPDGTGGRFTPILDHAYGYDNLVNVTAVPSARLYLMTSILRPKSPIVVRRSADAITWSAPATLVGPPSDGTRLTYPRIVVTDGGGLVLTYVVKDSKGWDKAALMRQGLRLTEAR